MSPLIRKKMKTRQIENALMQCYIPVSKEEIAERFPKISITTVERAPHSIDRLSANAILEIRLFFRIYKTSQLSENPIRAKLF